jgi:hypothetical protein
MRVSARVVRSPALLVVLGCVVLIAGCSGTKRSRTAPTTTTTGSASTSTGRAIATPSSIPQSAGSHVLDLSWISDARGWALVAMPCPSGACSQVLSTVDGGATWVQTASEAAVVLPGDSRQCQEHGCAHLRFASATVGYLWGQEGADSFFISVDGGQTWKRQSSPQVLALEATAGAVFRLVAPQGLPAPAVVERAPLGSSAWQRVDVGTGGEFGGTIATSHRSIYIAFGGHTAGGAGDAHTRFARSIDGGASWKVFGDPCGVTGDVEADATVSAAGPSLAFAVLCLPRTGGGAVSIRLSTDGGDHFGDALPSPIVAPATPQLALPSDSISVVAASGGAPHPSTVFRLGDHGRAWERVLTAPPAVQEGTVPTPWLGFQDSNVGRVSFGSRSVWTSHDRGSTWAESHLP